MQKSIDKMNTLIGRGIPISKAMKHVYKTRTVVIPFNKGDFDIPVSSLELSKRAANSLMRNNLRTLQEVIDYLDTSHWSSIKGFGSVSAMEVFEKILDVSFEQMDADKRKEFLVQIDAENEAMV